jgi:hypothetical protein
MNLFGPLDRKYCNYFYYMSVLSFIIFCISFIGIIFSVFHLIKNKKNVLNVFFSSNLLISSFLAYLVNRLMYTMCINSIK